MASQVISTTKYNGNGAAAYLSTLRFSIGYAVEMAMRGKDGFTVKTVKPGFRLNAVMGESYTFKRGYDSVSYDFKSKIAVTTYLRKQFDTLANGAIIRRNKRGDVILYLIADC